MPSEQMIVRDFDKLLAQYPGLFRELVAFVDELRQYGSLKQAASEAEKRLAEADAKQKAVADQIVAQEAASETERLRIEQEQEAYAIGRRAESDRVVRVATENAAKLMADARTKNEQLLAEGIVARNAVDQRVQEAQAAALLVEQQIAAKKAVLAEVETSIAARQADLARTEQAIADLRAKIA